MSEARIEKPLRSDMELMMTQTDVLSRPGWSRVVLEKLLGEPDKRKKVYRRPNPCALYLESRVVAAELSDVFKSLQVNVATQKASAAKGILTKENKLLAEVDAMEVNVILMPLPDVHMLAIDSYNARHEGAGCYVFNDSDIAFVDRVSVNFIRHELTKYDDALEHVAGRTGITKAIDAIREKVYCAIATAYPDLDDECERQCLARLDRDMWP